MEGKAVNVIKFSVKGLNLLNGQLTVEEIISLLAGHFRDDDNYPFRVTKYIMQLQKDGFIQLSF